MFKMRSMLSCRWSTVKWWRHWSFFIGNNYGLLARNYGKYCIAAVGLWYDSQYVGRPYVDKEMRLKGPVTWVPHRPTHERRITFNTWKKNDVDKGEKKNVGSTNNANYGLMMSVHSKDQMSMKRIFDGYQWIQKMTFVSHALALCGTRVRGPLIVYIH